jgi:hypothetical protein
MLRSPKRHFPLGFLSNTDVVNGDNIVMDVESVDTNDKE